MLQGDLKPGGQGGGPSGQLLLSDGKCAGAGTVAGPDLLHPHGLQLAGHRADILGGTVQVVDSGGVHVEAAQYGFDGQAVQLLLDRADDVYDPPVGAGAEYDAVPGYRPVPGPPV